MNYTEPFAFLVLVTAVVGLVAILSNHLTKLLKVPTPALFLIGAAIAVKVVPSLHIPPAQVVERVVTLALLLILFDGGMHIGLIRFRSAAAPIVVIGVLGTVLTTVAVTLVVHFAFGLGSYVSLLVATAVAPTDPAVVFSVLGQREISGRGGIIIEGESGANDPVGIALMASLITAGSLSSGAFVQIGSEFLLQMGIGLSVGIIGGWTLKWFMHRVPLSSEGLYPLRTLASAMVLFGISTLAHGSGFLSVFVAGIILGDVTAPYKREIERFHSALASLAEIIAFVVLGLTIDLNEIARASVWVPGLIIGLALAFIIRPVLVGLCLIPIRLKANQRAFVLFAGLKGAVPILLGSFLLTAHVPNASRLYGIIIVVVVFSVVVQGSLVPTFAERIGLPMRIVEPEPWSLGVRLRDEPSGVYFLTITPGSRADGRTIDDLANLPGGAWISLVVRDGQLVPVRSDSELRSGDDVLILADSDALMELTTIFELPSGR